MSGTSSVDDSTVRVVVTPSQSSYFAGEPFSVTITFTNIRSPESIPSRPYSHKRGAHSISSAPLARPPTSPGTPRASLQHPTQPPSRSTQDVPYRRGLIGKCLPAVSSKGARAKGPENLPELIEQRRKRLLARSMSVSIAPVELEEQLGEAGIIPSPSTESRFPSSSASPRISSPLARSDFALGSDHPHARKNSLFDGQQPVEVITTSFSDTSFTPNASTSTFSLALDSISEGTLSPYPSSPSLTSPSTEGFLTAPFPLRPTPSAPPPPLSRPQQRRTDLQIGLGHPPNSTFLHPPRTAFSTTFSERNAPAAPELILYSYAQLQGTLTLASSIRGVQPTPEQHHALNAVRSALLKRRAVVGGGSMDITSSPSSSLSLPLQHRKKTHRRSSSLSVGLLSLLSPSSLVGGSAPTSPVPVQGFSMSPSPLSPRYEERRVSVSGHSPVMPPALSGGIFSRSNGSNVSLGLGIPPSGGAEEDIDEDVPLPTFEVRPAMLAVDLALLPGESRTYTYSILLPENLPPTFKGRSLRFSYELVVGMCRATSGGTGSTSANSVSRVMKVPVRVYNHVSVTKPMIPYDILWPVLKPLPNSARAGSEQGKVVEEPVVGKKGGMVGKGGMTPSASASSLAGDTGTLEDLRDYARRLLASFPDDQSGEGKVNDRSGLGIMLPAGLESGASTSSFVIPPTRVGGGEGAGDGEVRRGLEEEREKEEERQRRLLQREMEWAEKEDREGGGGLTGCREAVEILTRTSKKASYDVTKDGVKVAVLTFPKVAYRLGETVLGVVEMNERTGRARVLQLSAMLEAHESLPSTFFPTNATSSRHLRRIHAEHHSSFTLNTLRTTFSLDIPSDASPAFRVCVGGGTNGSGSGGDSASGGLEWKVRLCLLVAVAKEEAKTGPEGIRLKSMVRDRARGGWASSWKATEGIAPFEKVVGGGGGRRSVKGKGKGKGKEEKAKTWSELFASAVSLLSGEEGEDEDEDEVEGEEPIGEEEEDEEEEEEGYDGVKPDMAGGVGQGVNFGGGEEGWTEVKVETVECEVPVRVWPGNTAFRAADVVFDV